MTLAIEGNEDALATLLEEAGPTIRRKIASRIPARLRSVLSEDDVMQQTYADAFRSIAQFVPLGEGAFRAWLASLAEFNRRDAVRMLEAEKRGGTRQKVGAAVAADSYVELLDILSSSATTPTRKVSRGETEGFMRRAIDTLPETYRAVVQMYDLEGHTARRVGETIGRSPGAVYMLRARAHDWLRARLGDETAFFSNSP